MIAVGSIRRKVSLALAATCLVALVAVAAAIWIFEYRAADLRARATLESLTQTLVPSLVASLDFDTPGVATESLRRLEAGGVIAAATVYRTAGNDAGAPVVFASYRRHGAVPVFPATPLAPGYLRHGDRALYTNEVQADGRPVALLQLEADIGPFRRGLNEALTILVLVLTVLGTAAVLLSRLLQRTLTRPLLELAATVERVRTHTDFTARAAITTRDEIGQLADGFNLMLAGIEQRDRQLAEQAAIQQAVLENAGVSIISADSAGIIRSFNATAEHMLGYRREEVIGKLTPARIHDAAEIARRAARLSQVLGRTVPPDFALFAELARNTPSALEWTYIRKDGTRLPVFLVISSLRAADGTPLGFCGIATDLTERKAAEEAVHASQELMRQSFEASPIGLALADHEGKILYHNRKIVEWFGYDTGAIPTIEAWWALAYPKPEYRAQIHRQWDEHMAAAAIGSGEMEPVDAEVTCRDGRRRLIEFRCQQFGNRALIAFSDITERKATEEALRLSQARLEAAQAQANIGNWDLSLATGAGFWSKQMFRLFNLEPSTPPPDYGSFIEMIHPEDRESLLSAHNEVIATGNAATTQYRTDPASGPLRYLEANIRIIRDSFGKPTNLAGTLQDITDRKQAEAEIHRLNAELEQRVRERTAELAQRIAEVEKLNTDQQLLNADLRSSQAATDLAAARLQEANANLLAANQELESFSYSVSHDLRAPLRNIAGFIELLRKRTSGHLDAEADRYFGIIGTEAVRMGSLIDDLLTFSRIGRAELHFAPVPLAALIAEVQSELQSDLVGRQVEWRIQPMPLVSGDRTLLRQVVVNLVSNAVKFTRQRHPAIIEIGAQAAPAEAELVTFFVRDNGAGFDPKYAAKLFGVFQRLHNPREFEGTGIGLANVKRIVNRHGGQVWAESTPNNGATFFFTLRPAGLPPPQTLTPPPPKTI